MTTLAHVMTKTGFLLTPHPQAPLYVGENPETLFNQALGEMENLTTTEPLRQLIRQTGLVSLWFFEKFIAGYNGPFNKLNTGLHLDMANFRQRCLDPGSRNAMFLGRKSYKTSVGTTGADPWEGVRDPDITIGVYHGVEDEAMGYVQVMQKVFDSNEFFAWLYPEHHVENPRTQPHWNSHELLLPSRKRFRKEPTVEVGSMGGSSQGRHYDFLDLDDIVGEGDLDANRASSIDMERKKNWFASNQHALIVDRDSRIMVKGTRYAINDVYEDIMQDVGEAWGYWKEIPYTAKPGGKWRVYYRQFLENGESIFPESMTTEELLKLQKDDLWTYSVWMQNNPISSGMSELVTHPLKECKLSHHHDTWWIDLPGGESLDMADLDVVQGGDPAATEKYMTSRTSRSAHVVYARDWKNRRFVVSLHADYVPITTFFDWLFDDFTRFKGLIRSTIPEQQGAFKILGPLLREEQHKRGVWLSVVEKHKTGEKDAVIRSTLTPILAAGQLYVAEPFVNMVNEEKNAFPLGSRKDILDALCIAEEASLKPLDPQEQLEALEARESFGNRSRNAVGY